jgi:hypothetical protein
LAKFFGYVVSLATNVPALGKVAKYGTLYFLLKIKILAKRKRELTTKPAIAPNRCEQQVFKIQSYFSQIQNK